jgi:hypothetical protein
VTDFGGCRFCSNWAREGQEWSDPHHVRCPLRPEKMLALLERLTVGIGKWAAEEDGVPDWLWHDFCAAACTVGTVVTVKRAD